MGEYFSGPKSLGKVKVELDLYNYATKTDLKNATGVDTSSFAKKPDLAHFKSDIDKLDIDKLKNLPNNVSNMKSKVDKLDVDKLVPLPVDLGKLSDIVKNYVVEEYIYNAKIKNTEDKIPGITNLVTKTTLDAKIDDVEGEIPSITNLATKTALNAVENKRPSVSNLVKKLTNTPKLMKWKTKITIHSHDKYITTPEFNNLTSARLKQTNLASKSDIANFVNKTDFDNKPSGFNRRINSDKTKHVFVENELNELTK